MIVGVNCLFCFKLNIALQDFVQGLKSSTDFSSILWKVIPQEMLLISFHLNVHILGFHPQTQHLELPYTLGIMKQLNVE